MARAKTHYICRDCGAVQTQWMGKCPDCGAWDALERTSEPAGAAETGRHAVLADQWIDDSGGATTGGATPLPGVVAVDVERQRCGIGELDRVLGGGFVPGSVTLVGGDPGIGKSTLLLQAAGALAGNGTRVLYASSEESAYQTRLRAQRLFASGGEESLDRFGELFILADTNLARIAEQARKLRPELCVIDSIQMVYSGQVEASPGSVMQIRRCCMELVYLAKRSGMAIVLVGHVTKDGKLAGPKLLEHLVDTVLSFEGDPYRAHRIVRAVKNRYGTTLEVGLFEMTGRGLEEVIDASVILESDEPPRPGSVICPVMHGTRSLLVEVQALTATGFIGNAKRKTSGLDPARLAMLIAVLEQHGGLKLADQDIFVSTVGGLRVMEPAADLALCLAITGAHYKRSLAPRVAVAGEVGLGGEIRAPTDLRARINEARRLGCSQLMTGHSREPIEADGCEVVAVNRLDDALGQLS